MLGISDFQLFPRISKSTHLSLLYHYRDDSRLVASQWGMALLCNDVSHWLGANLESALHSDLVKTAKIPQFTFRLRLSRRISLMGIYKWYKTCPYISNILATFSWQGWAISEIPADLREGFLLMKWENLGISGPSDYFTTLYSWPGDISSSL